jgi:hypothetical protein
MSSLKSTLPCDDKIPLHCHTTLGAASSTLFLHSGEVFEVLHDTGLLDIEALRVTPQGDNAKSLGLPYWWSVLVVGLCVGVTSGGGGGGAGIFSRIS